MKRLICLALIGLALAGYSQERREKKDIASTDVTANLLQAAPNLATKQATAAKCQLPAAAGPHHQPHRSTPPSGPDQPT